MRFKCINKECFIASYIIHIKLNSGISFQRSKNFRKNLRRWKLKNDIKQHLSVVVQDVEGKYFETIKQNIDLKKISRKINEEIKRIGRITLLKNIKTLNKLRRRQCKKLSVEEVYLKKRSSSLVQKIIKIKVKK